MGIFIALVIFSLLIFFHELGHFIAARFFKIHVEVFSIGFGKRILTKQIGQTQWSISTIPLGGYIRMKGQDDSDPSKKSFEDDSYNSKAPWQRIVISLAGPFANFFLAFLLYLSITAIGVPKLLSTVGDINMSQPAYEAGVRVGDTIRNINGQPILYWEEVGEKIQAQTTPISLTVLRDNNLIDFTITPKLLDVPNNFGEIEKRYLIGISPDINAIGTIHYGLSDGINYAYDQTQKASLYIFKSVQKLVMGLIPLENLSGVVGIVDTTAKVANMGMVALLFFTALISVNLGVINLLPIPALDGGHVLFNLYEMITKKAPNEEVMLKLTLMGWAILLSLMLVGLYNDIHRLLG
jgi:regulator of sigma E protease